MELPLTWMNGVCSDENLSSCSVCPYDSCGSTFKQLELFDEHMALHQASPKKEVEADMDYVSQYKRYINHMYKRGRITKMQASYEIKEMERTLLKTDDKTRTKGFCPQDCCTYAYRHSFSHSGFFWR